MFDSLANSLRGGIPDRLAQALGSDPRDTRRAMEVSLPALIGGLRDKTREDGGSADLFAALTGDAGVRPDDVDAFVSSGDARTGAGLLDRVFGDRGETALTSLSKASGLSTRLLARVMSMLAPIAVGWLDQKREEDDLDADGVSRFLEGEAAELEDKGYGKVLALLGGVGATSYAGVAAVTGATETVQAPPVEVTSPDIDPPIKRATPETGDKAIHLGEEIKSEPLVEVSPEELPDIGEDLATGEEDRRGSGWLWWVIAAVAGILAFGLLLSQCGGSSDPEGTETDTSPTATVVETANESIPAQDIEQNLAPTVDQAELDQKLSIYNGVTGRVEGTTIILEGVVPEASIRELAGEAANGVTNVGNVVNNVQVDQGNPLSAVIANNPANFSSLDLLLAEAGLQDALAGTGPYTVFAPVNSAVDRVPDLDAMRADPARLTAFLQYHVVQGSYTIDDLRNVDVIPTLLPGESIKVTQTADGKILLNDLVEIALSTEGDNGKLHALPGVLTPIVEGGITAPSELGETLDLGQIEFDPGSTTLTDAAEAELDTVVEFLIENPQPVEIAGHTDSDGAADFNLELSQDRADAVEQYLFNNGVDRSLMTAVGYGAEQPIASNDTAEGRKQNRRIEFNLGGE